MDVACSQHVLARLFDQWREQMAGVAHPISECGAIKLDAFARKDLRLPIQREVIGKLRDQHMGQQRRPCDATLNRPRWRRRLNDDIAPGARHLDAHMTNHLVGRGHAFKDLGNIFAQLAQLAAALRTRMFRGQMRVYLARQVIGQPATRWLGPGCGMRGRTRRYAPGLVRLKLFELQLQLFNLVRDLLALRAENHPPQLGDYQLEVFDFAVTAETLLALFYQKRFEHLAIETLQIRSSKECIHHHKKYVMRCSKDRSIRCKLSC